jgi:glycosyltransferase involved in cell wall biosynthesis
MGEATPLISVVVPTRDRGAQLEVCLASIRAALRTYDELLVVDSASTDPSVRAIAERHGATYVRCDVRGASRARNAGWRATRHAIIAFVDDDVVVDQGWAEACSQTFHANPGVAFITGYVGIPPDQVDTTERPVAEKLEEIAEVLDAAFTGVPGHSANMAARRQLLETLGGFDERLGAGADFHSAEDLDLFDRSYAAGLVGRFEPSMRSWHDQWRGRAELVRLDWGYGFGMGARISKLLRSDPTRAGVVAEVILWSWGLKHAYQAWRWRQGFNTLTSMVRVGGAVAGLARATPVEVTNGHFAARRSVAGQVARLRAQLARQ